MGQKNNKIKYIYLGSYYSGDTEKRIEMNSLGAISSANNKFQKNLIAGFKANNINIQTYSLPQIGAYPGKFKKLFFRGDNKEYWSFLNLKIVKHFSQFFTAYFKLKRLLNTKKQTDTFNIFIYDLHLPYLLALSLLKNKRKCFIVNIVPDLIGLTGERTTPMLKIWQSFQKKVLSKTINCVDAFSLITEEMNPIINLNNKPYCIVEGIASSDLEVVTNKTSLYGDYLFYAGALNTRNGLKCLVDAFDHIEDKSISLVICGDGDLYDYILEKAHDNPNIFLLGYQTSSVIWELECSSFALINPRPNLGEFVKYSFPSKVMEYFASNRPVIMYRLDGVPLEYYDYVYEIKATNELHLGFEITNIIHEIRLNTNSLLNRNFVISSKSAKTQVSKILNLVTK